MTLGGDFYRFKKERRSESRLAVGRCASLVSGGVAYFPFEVRLTSVGSKFRRRSPDFRRRSLRSLSLEVRLTVAHERGDAFHQVVGAHEVAERLRFDLQTGVRIVAAREHRALGV